MRDDFIKSKVFTRRSLILGIMKFVLLCIIFLRYYFLQITNFPRFSSLADKNRIKTLVAPPIRGIIVDRNGNNIATNQISYRLLLNTRDTKEIRNFIVRINDLLPNKIKLSDEDIVRSLKKTSRGTPLLIADNLTWGDVAKLEVQSIDSLKIIIEQGYKRFYNLRHLTAHLTGYVSTPNKKELEELSDPNFHEFLVGKNGVEKAFDLKLRGVHGIRKVEVDAKGLYIRELTKQLPQEGESLKLSIDVEIQQYIADLLGEREGSVALIDVTTGEVISLYSNPSYDPNVFIGGISTNDWNKISTDPKYPLINKAITSAYPPGSTFKIITALAALEAGVSPNFSVACTGKHQVGNRVFHCNRAHGHGNVDLKLALAQSCNVYFYSVAEKIGIKEIAHTARSLGFAYKTNVGLPFESKGHIPDPRWKFLRFGQKWTMGDTVNTSIGQGFTLVTPIQLAIMIARIASNKNIMPTVLYQNKPHIYGNLDCDANNLEIIRKGLFMVFNDRRGNGYKRRLNHPNFKISGKTGTAQVISTRKTTRQEFTDHGWFVGFAPYDKPKYAISVIVEHGSWGSISALPLAKQILLKAAGL